MGTPTPLSSSFLTIVDIEGPSLQVLLSIPKEERKELLKVLNFVLRLHKRKAAGSFSFALLLWGYRHVKTISSFFLEKQGEGIILVIDWLR